MTWVKQEVRVGVCRAARETKILTTHPSAPPDSRCSRMWHMTDVQAGEPLKKNRFPQEPHKLVRLFWNKGSSYIPKCTLITFFKFFMNSKHHWQDSTTHILSNGFLKKKQSVLQQWENTCSITDLKVSISTTVFCFVCYPPPEVHACYVWLTSRSLWQLSTHIHTDIDTQTDTHTYRVQFTAEKPQYLGFSNSYLEFPLVCEMGTFSLTDQQQ